MELPYSPEPEQDPDVALVLRAYAAFARGEMDEAVVGLHPEVEWIEPDEFPDGGRRVGPRAVAEYLRASRARWAELTSTPVAHRRGEQIVVVHHLQGRLVAGTPHQAEVADVFIVESGLITRMQACADPAEVLQTPSGPLHGDG